MSTPIQYASFLVRIWRENKAGEALPSADWHAEVEHIQSNQCWTFQAEEELLSFLHQQAQDIPVNEHTSRNESFITKPSAKHERSDHAHSLIS